MLDKKKGQLSEASCPEMLRGQSCFQLSAVEPITVSQTQSRLERRHPGPLHCVVFYWRIFIFDFKMSPELCFLSSKGEAFPNIGESQRWNTRGTWRSMNDQLNDAGTQVLCP